MATRKAKPKDDEPAPESVEFVATEATYTPEDMAVDSLLQELGGEEGASLRIYREGAGGYRDLTFIDEMGIADFNPKLLKYAPYNGGTFRIHVRTSEGLKGNKQLKVEPGPKAPDPAPVTTPDPHAITRQDIIEIVRAAIPVAPPAPSRADMLAEMRLMAEIFRPAPVPAQSDPFNDVTRALGLIEGVKRHIPKSEGGDGESVLSVAREGIQVFGELIRNNKSAAPQSPVLAAPQEIQQNPAPHGATEPEGGDMNMIPMYVRMAIGAAKKDAPVDSMAGLVVDHADDALIETLIRGQTDQGIEWFEVLKAVNPDVSAYRPWFDKLRAKVVEYCTPSDDSTQTPDGAQAAK